MNDLLACSQLFMQLQALEPMLNPRYAVSITRYPGHDVLHNKGIENGAYLVFAIHDHASALFNVEVWSMPINPHLLIDGKINAEEYAGAVWKNVPSKYKQK